MSLRALQSKGRGHGFTRARGVRELVSRVLYAGDWPARALDRWGRARVDLIEHRIEVPRAGRPPLRIGFVSDLHLGPLTPPRLLEAAFDRLAAAAPEVLVLGGDYVFLEATAAKAERIARLVARVPAATKIAVLGNHDLWTDHALLERALERGGARVLVNRALRLPPPHDDVALVGLDDPWTGAPDPDRAFAEAGDAAVRIAVVHAPEGYPYVRDRGAALMLCGHTHGGQIAAPRGPVVVHGHLGRRWPAGLYDVDGLPLFVSRGIGAVEIPLRLYAPPDVAIFTLA
jgi:predicted MPP superfamily phosphohydrolase